MGFHDEIGTANRTTPQYVPPASKLMKAGKTWGLGFAVDFITRPFCIRGSRSRLLPVGISIFSSKVRAGVGKRARPIWGTNGNTDTPRGDRTR